MLALSNSFHSPSGLPQRQRLTKPGRLPCSVPRNPFSETRSQSSLMISTQYFSNGTFFGFPFAIQILRSPQNVKRYKWSSSVCSECSLQDSFGCIKAGSGKTRLS